MNIVSDLLRELQSFPGREEGLRKIKRFSIEKIVFYRSSDFSHSKRVAWLVASLADVIRSHHPDFDFKRALATALVHDDAELLTGDIQAGNKSKMTPAQLAQLEEEEREAIRQLAARSPKNIGSYSYQELMEDVLDLHTKEAQITKYLDRFDALGESLHEHYAGNTSIIEPVVNEFGTIPIPFEFYHKKLPAMIESSLALKPLHNAHPIFSVPERRDWTQIIPTFVPHTRESLYIPVAHPQYDAWRSAILSLADEEEIANLHTQQEFL